MKEHEFWRERAGGHVYAVELVDGLVAGTCGPLLAGDVDERFLTTFDYAPDQAAWLESRRDDFDVYDPIARHPITPVGVEQPLLERRLVSDGMHHGVVTCHSGSSLHDVARMMAANGIHAVVVWGDEEDDSIGFRGMISDRDLVAAAARGESLAGSALGAARSEPVSVRASATLLEAAQIMGRHQTTHLLVQDDRDRPVGILSALDVARALAAPL